MPHYRVLIGNGYAKSIYVYVEKIYDKRFISSNLAVYLQIIRNRLKYMVVVINSTHLIRDVKFKGMGDFVRMFV